MYTVHVAFPGRSRTAA